MQIKTVIEIFKAALIIYQKAVDEKWNYKQCKDNCIECGLCNYTVCIHRNWDVYDLFDKNEGYYKYFINEYSYVAPRPSSNDVKKPLQLRIKFLKQQIPELNNLLLQGYTDV